MVSEKKVFQQPNRISFFHWSRHWSSSICFQTKLKAEKKHSNYNEASSPTNTFFTLYLTWSHPIHTQPPCCREAREWGRKSVCMCVCVRVYGRERERESEWEERGGVLRDGLCARLFMWLFQPHASYNYVKFIASSASLKLVWLQSLHVCSLLISMFVLFQCSASYYFSAHAK